MTTTTTGQNQGYYIYKYASLSKSIFNGAQYVPLDSKRFFLATPPIKLKPELHIRWGLLIANHLHQSL
jgi:hypothetical protein